MSDLEIWITIFALVAATAVARSSFWLVGHHITIPPRVQEMLRYAPGSALAAINQARSLGYPVKFINAEPDLVALRRDERYRPD